MARSERKIKRMTRFFSIALLVISFQPKHSCLAFVSPKSTSFSVTASSENFHCWMNGEWLATQDSYSETNGGATDRTSVPKLMFPGGGIFFYWQAGAVSYLRENGYDLTRISMSGASAGALTATLSTCNVDFERATHLALGMAEQAGVWDRRGGLQGIWGPMIEEWLDELLPDNAATLANDNKLSLLITPIPTFGKTRITSFSSKDDLIRCNMASIHLPWFLDGSLTADFRDTPHIDGSFLAETSDYFPGHDIDDILILDFQKDPAVSSDWKDFVKALSKDGIWGLLEQGKSHARIMEERGEFASLPRIESDHSSLQNTKMEKPQHA